MQTTILHIPYADILPDTGQARKHFPPDAIERKAASIRDKGLFCPLRVRRDGRQKWTIISGELRYHAIGRLGWDTVPCIPVEGELTEAEVIEEQVQENELRTPLERLDLARAVERYKGLTGCNNTQAAQKLHLHPSDVTKLLSLLKRPEDIQDQVNAGRLPVTAAYELSKLTEPDKQRELAGLIGEGRLKRDSTAERVRALTGKKRNGRRPGRALFKTGGC